MTKNNYINDIARVRHKANRVWRVTMSDENDEIIMTDDNEIECPICGAVITLDSGAHKSAREILEEASSTFETGLQKRFLILQQAIKDALKVLP